MIVLGLTGSIGMGKSTTADLFRAEGIAVHDSDAAVHELYAGPGIEIIAKEFPAAIRDGRVDRAALSALVVSDPAALAKLESIVHPLVGKSRDDFLSAQRSRGATVVVLDIPLLFEIGGDNAVDAVVVVTASADEQRKRVLARPGMSEAKFERILSKQLADAEKQARAHFLVHTGRGVDDARRQVRNILMAVASMQASGDWQTR